MRAARLAVSGLAVTGLAVSGTVSAAPFHIRWVFMVLT